MPYDPLVTKQQLIDAARSLLERDGWDGTTGLAILKHSKLSNGSWRHFFPRGKLDVAAAIYPQLHDAIWNGVVEELAEAKPGDPKVALRRAMGALISRVVEDRRRARLLFELEAVLRPAGAGDPVGASDSKLRKQVVEAFTRAASLDPSELDATLIFGLMFGATLDLCRQCALGRLKDVSSDTPQRAAQSAWKGLQAATNKRTVEGAALPEDKANLVLGFWR